MQPSAKPTLIQRFIGDRAFYRRVLVIVLPMIIQNTITNVVSLLDNVMVGQIGTLQMTSVAIANQLMFVFNLCIFGGFAGPGIFATQYAGAGDHQGVRHCFRLKLMLGLVMLAVAAVIFTLFPQQLIAMYLTQGTAPADAAVTLDLGLTYLSIMLAGLLPFALTQAYASTLRETGETRLPMIASIAAILVNLVFNYLLIFGKFGFPQLGVAGAAIATVLSRYVETTIIIVYTHARHHAFPFIEGAFRSLRVPADLCLRVFQKGSPLLINEFLWSSGMAMLMQCYSTRGLEVVAATNISSTVANLFNVVFLSMGSAVSIMVGQALGANDTRDARRTATRLLFTAVMVGIVMGTVMLVLAPAIPQIYNTEDSVRDLACSFLRIVALLMPVYSFAHSTYFILRSGGRTLITFLFDSMFTWTISFPCAWSLAHLTGLPIVPMYFCVQALDLIKCVIGAVLVKKGVWVRNIVSDAKAV